MIIFARWVAPVSSPPMRDAYVEIAGDRIVDVQRCTTGTRRKADFEFDQGILVPGLINVHTHLELAAYAGQIPPMPFWDWISRLVRLRRAPGVRQRELESAKTAAWDSLRAGITTVGDISRRGDTWRVLADVPIRKVCFAELLEFADDPPRSLDELEATLDAAPSHDLLTGGISPHTPWSVRAASIRKTFELARRRAAPWTMHFLETPEERAFLDGDGDAIPAPLGRFAAEHGITPPAGGALAALGGCSVDGAGGLLAHVNYVRDDEIAALARMGHSVGYCPRAHRFFGHAPHPWLRLLAAGVRVVIGTDSPASNQSVSLLDELRFCATALAEDGGQGPPYEGIGGHVPRAGPPAPADLLRMVTLDAAAALGFAERLGSIEPGKPADLAAFPLCSESTEFPLDDLIHAAPSAAAVWVAGQRVI